jgi:hypothetical protein
MKSIIRCTLILLSLALGVAVQAQIVFTETFNYAAGALCDDSTNLNPTSPYYPLAANNVSGGLWINGSSSKNDDPLLVQPGALTYAGYILSGIGNKVWCPNLPSNTSNNRASSVFPAQSGKIYYAAMVNLANNLDLSSSTSSGGEYLFGVYSSTSFSSSAGRALVTFRSSDSTGKYQIGVRASSTSPAGWVAMDLDTAKTYLVAVSYDRSTGVAQIWINPTLTGTEPAPNAASSLGAADPNADIGRFGIYQRGDRPHAHLGGIRVGTSWIAVSNVAPFPLAEIFDYRAGALCDVSATLNPTSAYYPVEANNVSNSIWMNGSSSKNDDPLLVQAEPLVYPGYPLSGMGKKVWCPNLPGNSSNNRASRQFEPQTGKVFFSAMVNLPGTDDLSSSTSSGGEYLLGLYTSTSFATAAGRGLVTFRSSATAGKFQIGVRATSTSTAGWVAKDLDAGTTQLVVVGYDRTSGVAEIWVNPVIAPTLPASDASSSIGATDANADIGRIGIYQRGTKPHAYVGGILVSSDWPLSFTGMNRHEQGQKPVEFAILDNYPNPFNPVTRIVFTLSATARTTLRIFNVRGQEIAQLFDQQALEGKKYEISFNAALLPSGVYYARLESGVAVTTHKMLLLK